MCVCVKLKFQFATGGNWKSSTTCKLVFNRFWKPSVSSLYFLYKQSQKTPLHLIVSRSEQKEHFNAEIRLPYSNWFDHLSLCLPFKLFIWSWSLWSNSTHPDESSRVESSKASRRTKHGNWIIIQMLKVKSGLFLLKLEIHCMTGRKVKLTWNDQNTNHFLENLKTVQLECEIFRVSVRQGEIWYLQKPNKMLMPVLAVYDLPSMYFISFACSVGTTKFCQWKRKL